MSKESLTVLGSGFGYESPQSGVPSLKTVLQELQGINLAIVSGDVAGGIAYTVSGVATDDTIIAAWEVPTAGPTATTLKDRTASTYISAANTVKCNEGIGSGSSLLVILWFNKA